MLIACGNDNSGDNSINKKTPKAQEKNQTKEKDYSALLVFNDDGTAIYHDDKEKNVFRKSTSGLEYKFIVRNDIGKSPAIGDVILISLNYKNSADSTIFDSEKIDANFKMRVQKPSHPGGCIEEAYMMMRKGDSAVFLIDAHNFYTYTQNLIAIPDYIKPEEKLSFYIKIKDILSNDEFISKNSELYNHQLKQEESLINRFLLSIDFDAKIYKSGLIKVLIESGTGKQVEMGDLVTIDYTASFIDGAVFDSSLDRSEAFLFTLGNNEVIKGLEEAVLDMKVGEYSLIIIPFRLAYGEEKKGLIPPFSTLVFETELLDAKKQ